MSITEFLEARIAEDEAAAREVEIDFEFDPSSPLRSALDVYAPGYDTYPVISIDSTRVLAECAAKRAIIGEHAPVDYSGIGMTSPNACKLCGVETSMSDWEWAENSFPCATMRHLAVVYKDHPDYRQEWALDGPR